MKFTSLLFIMLLGACASPPEKIEADPSLLRGYIVRKDAIIYQFFEKYGFTDLCTHTRSYFEWKPTAKIKRWKKLPITTKDLQKINNLTDKVDDVDSLYLPILYLKKDYFEDISVEQREFKRDSVVEDRVALQDGYYRIGKDVFEIYFTALERMYVERHGCP